MKRLLNFFKNRWITSILGLAAVSVLIWFVGPLIAIAGMVPLQSEITRLVAIIVCLLVWGLNNLRSQATVSKANSDLAEEIAVDSAPGG